jgi:two-component system, cell cycle sensor histidine kinase PleC
MQSGNNHRYETSYVAIVDDLEINRCFLENLSRNVDNIGQVKTFDCAKKALDDFKVHAPDLIITDFSMPAMDASAFLGGLRNMPGFEDTPVVVVSATREAENRRMALLCGATDFLTSPFDAFEFQVRIRNLLKLALHQKFLRAHSLSLHQELTETRLCSLRRSRNQEEKFNTVIDCVPALIFAVGDGAGCIFSNKYCFDFFGHHKGHVFSAFVERLMNINQHESQGAVEITASDGYDKASTFLIMRSSVPAVADSRGFTVFSGIDISSLKQTQESLRIAKCHAEAANNAKSNFLANMSHEIRTPLNAIIGFADIMDGGIFGHIEQERYRDYIKDILHSSQYLLSIINEILDFSQIERGEQSIFISKFLLSECILNARKMLDQDLNAKGNALTFDFRDDLELMSDYQKLTQILLNLITNANKSSENGVISISVRRNDRCGATISVEDQGIGMTKPEITIAMSDFGRVSNTQLSSVNRGVGLGLPISSRLMRLLGGELSICSKRNVGTRVDLIFPASAAFAPGITENRALVE